jgi:hypothetical protein
MAEAGELKETQTFLLLQALRFRQPEMFVGEA